MDPRLALITCRQGPGHYTLGILNNTWRELPLAIRSLCGEILELRETPLDCSEMGAVGCPPENVSTALLADRQVEPAAAAQVLGPRGGFWLAAAPRRDLAGHLWDAHAPVHHASAAQQQLIRGYLQQPPLLPVILDAILDDADAEFLEATALK